MTTLKNNWNFEQHYATVVEFTIYAYEMNGDATKYVYDNHYAAQYAGEDLEDSYGYERYEIVEGWWKNIFENFSFGQAGNANLSMVDDGDSSGYWVEKYLRLFQLYYTVFKAIRQPESG